MTHLNDISKTYLEKIAEKKDDSYLETDMKKRQKNNEKAVADMKKVKDDTVPRWMKEGAIADRLKAMAAEKKKDWDKKGEKAVADASKAMDKVKKTQKDMESSSFVQKESKKLDPVGQEDADIDNDGDVDKSDKYLHKKRKAIGKAISKKKGEDEEDEEEVEESVVVKRKTLGSRFKNEAERQAYLKKLDQKSKEKRLNKLRATVEEVEEVELDEKFKTQYGDKTKLSQSSERKSLGRGSSIKDGSKSSGYESKKEFRDQSMKLRKHRERFGDLAKEEKNIHGEVEVPSGNIGKLAKKASKRIDTDVDGDVEHNDKHKGEYGEFVPSPDGKGRTFTGPKKVRKESFSNWREDLIEVVGEKGEEKIKEMSKNQKNKITINPKLGEAVEEIGGTLIEMIEVDEMDVIIESIYEELIEEGYTEDDVEEAIEFVLTEDLNEASDKYYDSAVKASKKAGDKIKRAEMMKMAKGRLRYLGRKTKEKYGSVKKKVGMASAKAQVAAYNKFRDVAQTAGDKKRKAKKAVTDVPKKVKSGIKAKIRKTAQKVVDRMSEELSVDDQMRISREAAKKRNPNPDHKAIRGKMLKKPLPKDTRTDAQKMTDATGPRPGSRYRGD